MGETGSLLFSDWPCTKKSFMYVEYCQGSLLVFSDPASNLPAAISIFVGLDEGLAKDVFPAIRGIKLWFPPQQYCKGMSRIGDGLELNQKANTSDRCYT